jgi:hypothetical protein
MMQADTVERRPGYPSSSAPPPVRTPDEHWHYYRQSGRLSII